MMQTSDFQFQGHTGEQLSGALDRPEGTIKAFALFAHCFTCSKDFVASRYISQALAEQGIATLRFDFTGLGHSHGDFANTHFSSNVEDIIFAANALADSHQAPKLLIGHSLGGAAVLAAAPFIHSATAVVTLAAPFDPSHVLHLFAEDIESIHSDGAAEVDLFGRRFTITKKFVNDINQTNQRLRISNLRKALLVMHAPSDTLVGIENAKMIFDAALHPKSFISLDDMDHLLTNKDDVVYAAGLLASWAERYIHQSPKRPLKQPPRPLASDTVTVITTNHGPYSLSMQAGPHTVFADEPLDMGGKDTGASPYDFLLMALGSCTAMTLRMYAKHKQIELENVKVVCQQQRRHAKDCNDCGSSDGFVHEIQRDISVTGPLTDAQKERLLSIADKCPVHKTLMGEIKVKTKLV